MRFYRQQHQFYCGVDLHAKRMYVCLINREGEILIHRNIQTRTDHFLALLRDQLGQDLIVGVECMFKWYWLADLCREHAIPFVLGHAWAMKAIHGGKTKNDKRDSEKIAVLLRGGAFPLAYAYPKEKRATRDLLRRRMHLVRRRAELMGHVRIINSQYNGAPIRGQLQFAKHREGVAERFAEESVRKIVEVDLALIETYSQHIRQLENYLSRHAKLDNPGSYYRLLSFPSVGEVLALVLTYEIDDICRFPKVGDFLSYCRLVPGSHMSDGKYYGSPGRKMGNPYLKWAFSEIAVLLVRDYPEAKQYVARLEKRFGKGKALSILATRIGRACYVILKRGEVFDRQRFFKT